MKHYRVFALMLLLLLVIPVFVAGAQDFTDTDGDSVPDSFDGCPSEAGLPENYGCPAGVIPLDSDSDTLPDVSDSCPDLPGEVFMGGCPDADGDQTPDNFDVCPGEVGLSQNSGCPAGVIPDLDGDGSPDREDFCIEEPGDPANAGCPPERLFDFDEDGIIDFNDGCPGEAGSAENGGCPEGRVPDRDFDGVPDSEDQCPRQSGSAQNAGCLVDADGDYLPDEFDACPDQAGDGRNEGCPLGVSAPDSDQDGVPDIYDRCPGDGGANGADCPDADGDFVSDIDDLCPSETGDIGLQGCAPILQTSLPGRAPMSVANAAQMTLLGELRVGAINIDVDVNQTLAVQTYTNGLLIYDLSASPITFSVLESQVGQIAMSGDGSVVIDTIFDQEAGTPAVTVWDAASGTASNIVPITEEFFTNNVDLTQDGSIFATAHGAVGPFAGPAGTTPEGDSRSVRLWETASGTSLGVLEQVSGVAHVAFSADGSRLAVGTDAGVTIWDVASGQQLGAIDAIPPFSGNALAFSPDGTRLAVGQADGMLGVWDATSFANIYLVELLPDTGYVDAVVAVTFSADGSMIAASGGPFVDGPPPPDENVQVVVLDASNGARLAGAQHLNGIPFSVRFSADSSLLILPTGNGVQFWGVAQ
jgi:WD40 repeat protein